MPYCSLNEILPGKAVVDHQTNKGNKYYGRRVLPFCRYVCAQFSPPRVGVPAHDAAKRLDYRVLCSMNFRILVVRSVQVSDEADFISPH
jgi:hypothetical protein